MSDGTVGRRDRFDLVVVGSGPAGATYARTVSDLLPQTRILVVESGPIVATPPGRHLRSIADLDKRFAAQLASQGPDSMPEDVGVRRSRAESVSTGREAAVVARPGTWLLGEGSVQPGEDGMPAAAMSANVGGMGSHWTGACPNPGAGEWIGDLDPNLLEGAFACARRLLRVSASSFQHAPLGNELRRLLSSGYDQGRRPERRVQPMPLALTVDGDGKRYWTGPDVIFGDLFGSPYCELRPETTARAITPGAGGFSVALHDRRRDVVTEVGAQFVVVAADPLRTPQLLYASGLRPAALGHYLNDQPQVCGTVRLHRELAGDPARLRHSGDGSVDRLSGVSWVPYDIDRFPYHGQIMQLDASPVPVDPSFETWPGSIVECGLFAAKDLRHEDRVEFDSSRLDYFGLPSMRIHYDLTDRDREAVSAMIDEVAKMSALLGEPVGGAGPVVFPNGSSIHYQGTVRLGRVDDGTSVCDTRMQVWGVNGLYVGGNGVIPTPTACNPTLTNVALSVIGGRDIASRL